VFRALPVAVTFLKIEETKDKRSSMQPRMAAAGLYTWAPHCYAYNLAKQLTPRDEEDIRKVKLDDGQYPCFGQEETIIIWVCSAVTEMWLLVAVFWDTHPMASIKMFVQEPLDRCNN
jgi:hypothetical protein